jgi:hypothetical protein
VRYLQIGAAAVLSLYAAFGVPKLPKWTPPSAVIEIVEPARLMKTEVRPVVKVVQRMSPLDRLWLQKIYTNAARVVATDGLVEPETINTTEGLRAIHIAILKYIWRGMAENPPGEYEGLNEAINAVFREVVGDDRRGLTPELRRRAVEMFEALAWAGMGKDE